jgi:hypothetical protein
MKSDEDLTLLQRFEPILRFTKGESFFPSDLDVYVRESSLWEYSPGTDPVCIKEEGELSLENLSDPEPATGRNSTYYLLYISPLNIRDLALYQLRKRIRGKKSEDQFHVGSGRLARVGYLSRFVDAFFSLSLLARGRVPGDTAISAIHTYQRSLSKDPVFRYYGRVINQGDWIVLQYWFFYPFNNWRSGFYGVNDHEADWELVCIYLYKENGEYKPEWVACAMHDLSGDDLRRRWDDPELRKIGEHPIVFVAAGSHAAYFSPGEYLAEIELNLVSRFVQPITKAIVSIRRNLLGETISEERNKFAGIRIPFVDYARGDGKSIGQGMAISWDDPVVLDANQRWVIDYRGLWGLYVKDPVAGENAPAGPRYQRDGSVRRVWIDPVGWAGLDKVVPPPVERAHIHRRIQELQSELQKFDNEINNTQRKLTSKSIESMAIQAESVLPKDYKARALQVNSLSKELETLKYQQETLQNTLFALIRYEQRLETGVRPSARDHLRRPHNPESKENLRINRIAEAWAAISVGLLMIGLILIILFARQALLIGLAGLIGGFIFFEGLFRGDLNRLVVQFSSVMATIAGLILIYEFFWYIIVFLVLIAGAYIMWENLRELWI